MSPSGGLRGRRGSILGTAVLLGRRGYSYDNVHFLGALTTFSSTHKEPFYSPFGGTTPGLVTEFERPTPRKSI